MFVACAMRTGIGDRRRLPGWLVGSSARSRATPCASCSDLGDRAGARPAGGDRLLVRARRAAPAPPALRARHQDLRRRLRRRETELDFPEVMLAPESWETMPGSQSRRDPESRAVYKRPMDADATAPVDGTLVARFIHCSASRTSATSSLPGGRPAGRSDPWDRLVDCADLRGGAVLRLAHRPAGRLLDGAGAGVSMGWSEALSEMAQQSWSAARRSCADRSPAA